MEDSSAPDGRNGRRVVESQEQRGQEVSPDLHVQAAPPVPIQRSRLGLAPAVLIGADVGRHAGTEQLPVEASRHGQNGIPDGLSLQSPHRKVMEKSVPGIEFQGQSIPPARHAVSAAQQDQALDGLDRPAFLHETVGQKIQQLGVAGPIARLAEVVYRRHDPFPKVVLPDAIDHHPGRQRIPGVDDPVRQLQAPASLHDWGLILTRQDLKEAPRDLRTQILVIPPQMNTHVPRISVLAGHGESGGGNPVVHDLALTLHLRQRFSIFLRKQGG